MAVLEGSPETCDAKCTVSTIEICQGGDGCCPEGCNGMNDGDCPLLCGNKIVEPGELCDGTCPKSCISNNACTPMTVIGSNLTCDSQCVPAETITACLDGDGCCPGGCNESNDNDCDPTQTCAIDIEIQCIDSPWYAALAIISVAAAPGRMTWAYPPNNQPLLNFCTNNNGIPGQFLETSSGCVSATYETGTCVMPELLDCEATLCYECP
jgi:hypothetical protein